MPLTLPVKITFPSRYIVMGELKYKEITEKIIGASMKVHAILGNGFQEVIYQRALALQMENEELEFIRECHMQIFYL